MELVIIGIDPGLEGGIGIIKPLGDVYARALPVLEDRTMDIKRLGEWINVQIGIEDAVIYLEQLGIRGKGKAEGRVGNQTAAVNYGELKGMFKDRGYVPTKTLIIVKPQDWKKRALAGMDYRRQRVACTTTCPDTGKLIQSTRMAKNTLAPALFCSRRFPDVSLMASTRARKPHSGICDALCIAEAGRIMETAREKGLIGEER